MSTKITKLVEELKVRFKELAEAQDKGPFEQWVEELSQQTKTDTDLEQALTHILKDHAFLASINGETRGALDPTMKPWVAECDMDIVQEAIGCEEGLTDDCPTVRTDFDTQADALACAIRHMMLYEGHPVAVWKREGM